MRRRKAVSIGLCALLVSGLFEPTASSQVDPPTVHFSALGDISSSTNAGNVLNTVAALNGDLTLALGDLSYGVTGQEQAWCDFVTSRVGAGYPFELLAGNHESDGLNGNINDFSACLPNQLPGVVGTYGRQWYVDVPADVPLARFVMISPALSFPDGYWAYTAGTPRYQWTANAIDGARSAGIPWVVVGMHMPCLSLGDYACGSGTDLNDMLVAKKVDLVLSGHEHLYQRTKQLNLGGACATIVPGTYTPGCVADSDSDLVKGAGTVFATPGTGGTPLRNVNAADPEAGYFAASSGLNEQPTFGALDVSATADVLSASFAPAGTGAFRDAFTITRSTGPPNEPPTASFTSSCDELNCGFNGSGSSDPDGSIANYAWEFGDGATDTGVTPPTHTYANAGTYTARLTVTDDDGSTATTTRSITVTGPTQPTVYASDDFNRTVASGFGTAQVGGTYTYSNAISEYAVNGSVGTVRVPAGAGPAVLLPSVSTSALNLRVKLSSDKPSTGSGLYLSVLGRRIAGAGDYRAKLWIAPNGRVGLSLERTASNGAGTVLVPTTVISGLTYAVGDTLNVRLEVTGTSPTALRAKVWKQGTTEPAAWIQTVTDSTAALQGAGAIGVYSNLSASATNGPISVRIDDLSAVAP